MEEYIAEDPYVNRSTTTTTTTTTMTTTPVESELLLSLGFSASPSSSSDRIKKHNLVIDTSFPVVQRDPNGAICESPESVDSPSAISYKSPLEAVGVTPTNYYSYSIAYSKPLTTRAEHSRITDSLHERRAASKNRQDVQVQERRNIITWFACLNLGDPQIVYEGNRDTLLNFVSLDLNGLNGLNGQYDDDDDSEEDEEGVEEPLRMNIDGRETVE